MYCLNCRTPITTIEGTCRCGVYLPSLFRDVLPRGTQLAGGQYEVEYPLGRGGFGVTYQAVHQYFGRGVAIKEFFPQELAHREGRTGTLITPVSSQEAYQNWLQRFKREGQILFDLNQFDPHPSIVRVQNLFEERSTIYLVMELLEGRTLQDELKQQKGKPLEEARIVAVMDALVSALVKVHSCKLFHLDIKPANIMTTKDGRIVLLDFGAAKFEGSGTKLYTTKSTFAYSEDYAPLELTAEERELIGSGTDIFEVGMVLHEMLTGEKPPKALSRLLGQKSWQPTLPEPWQGLVASALRMNVAERPGNIEAWWGRYRRAKSGTVPEDLDREMTLGLSRQEMRNGCKKEVEGREGKLVIRVPAGVREGQKLRIAGKGAKSVVSDRRGDLYLDICQQRLNCPTFKYKTVKVNETGEIIKRETREAEYYSEDLGNGVVLELVRIKGGRFIMGSPGDEEGRGNSESPQHEVNLAEYWLGKYAVTQEQWQAVMGDNQARFKGAKRPVENVSWNEAQEYCQKLSQRTGREYRLPSEAQWEYACRAGTQTPFYYGETLSTEVANYAGSYTYSKGKKGIDRGTTVEVGSLPGNEWGLYEMHGNVWEWCEDDGHENYEGAPSDGRAWVDGDGNTRKILRGGSWYYYPQYCRSAFRFSHDRTYHISSIGFRVLCVAPD